ncbi:MAG: hypothetical protein ACFFDO_01855 [Candidatus Thorarchaeota archaeon]
MVNIADIEKLLEDFMLSSDITFSELRPYLMSEFDWKVDPLKKSQFMVRGLPISDEIIISDLLKKYLPNETIVLKEI